MAGAEFFGTLGRAVAGGIGQGRELARRAELDEIERERMRQALQLARAEAQRAERRGAFEEAELGFRRESLAEDVRARQAQERRAQQEFERQGDPEFRRRMEAAGVSGQLGAQNAAYAEAWGTGGWQRTRLEAEAAAAERAGDAAQARQIRATLAEHAIRAADLLTPGAGGAALEGTGVNLPGAAFESARERRDRAEALARRATEADIEGRETATAGARQGMTLAARADERAERASQIMLERAVIERDAALQAMALAQSAEDRAAARERYERSLDAIRTESAKIENARGMQTIRLGESGERRAEGEYGAARRLDPYREALLAAQGRGAGAEADVSTSVAGAVAERDRAERAVRDLPPDASEDERRTAIGLLNYWRGVVDRNAAASLR